MTRNSLAFLVALTFGADCFATMSPAFKPKSTIETSPSPQGDTKMGADAAASGTDIQDQGIQEEEAPYTPADVGTKSPHEKNELEENQNDIKSN